MFAVTISLFLRGFFPYFKDLPDKVPEIPFLSLGYVSLSICCCNNSSGGVKSTYLPTNMLQTLAQHQKICDVSITWT